MFTLRPLVQRGCTRRAHRVVRSAPCVSLSSLYPRRGSGLASSREDFRGRSGQSSDISFSLCVIRLSHILEIHLSLMFASFALFKRLSVTNREYMQLSFFYVTFEIKKLVVSENRLGLCWKFLHRGAAATPNRKGGEIIFNRDQVLIQHGANSRPLRDAADVYLRCPLSRELSGW